MSKFKLGLTIVFSVFIVFGVVIFALSKGSSSTPPVTLTVWGYLSQNTFTTVSGAAGLVGQKNLTVNYVQENPATFENDFINALANGNGPDIVMISQDMLYQNENKLLLIPYTTYAQRTLKDTFVQEGEIFSNTTGLYAIPFSINPMVMYWNRDIFNTAGIALPPTYWDQLLTLPAKLTSVDRSGNITESAAALGEWNNVVNAKAIISNLLLQAGNPIIDTSTGAPQADLNQDSGEVIAPAESAINFYTEFANPTSATYSWNRAEPDSLTDFLSGNLAVYFGFASELATIRAKNPNLNFDVAAMPEARPVSGASVTSAGTASTLKKTVFANIYGLAIVRQSKNATAAYSAILALTGDTALSALTQATALPPVSRTLLSTAPADAYQSIFYQSALISNAWLDPNATASSQIFQNMIESITSGQADTSTAINQANSQLSALLH